MAGVTRVNGLNVTVGTAVYSMASVYRLTVKDTGGTAIDLRDEDDAVDEAVELIIKEINPLAYSVVDGGSGVIHLIVDNNISPKDIKTRVRNMGSAIGPNSVDVTGSELLLNTTFSDGGPFTEVDA
mgnify:CR=1 FL=1